jgi:hypothetical protein
MKHIKLFTDFVSSGSFGKQFEANDSDLESESDDLDEFEL